MCGCGLADAVIIRVHTCVRWWMDLTQVEEQLLLLLLFVVPMLLSLSLSSSLADGTFWG